ncbi:MAG: Rv3235 family protein, partial [Streptomycetales bacterium]
AYRPAVPPTPRPAVLGLPDPHGPAIRLAQAIVEVLAGARPASQLLRWTTQQVYTGILTRVAERPPRGTATAPVPAGPEASSGTRPARACARVHVTRVCEPADGVAEASVMVRWGPRSRAMALRLEARNGCWICTALELGP